MTVDLSHPRPRQVINYFFKHSTEDWKQSLAEAERSGHLGRKKEVVAMWLDAA